MNVNYMRVCLHALLALLWMPTLAFAGVTMVAIDNTVAVPLTLVILAAALSSLSGATALVLRIDKELRAAPEQPLLRPWLFCAAHMLGSWLAGALGFMLSQQAGGDVWLKLVTVIVASFMGARFIEAVAERYLPRATPLAPPKDVTP